MQSISIVIPAKNEGESIGKVLEEVNRVCDQLDHLKCEVIVVDDHSTDGTATIAEGYGAKVVKNQSASGKGVALRVGFAQAQGDIVVMIDADFSHQAEDIPRFIQILQDERVGLVVGSRSRGGSDEYTPLRTLGNVWLTALLNILIGIQLTDSLNGYKAFRRVILDSFRYTSKTFEIEIELIANARRLGYKVVEIASHERARAAGRAKSRVIAHGTRFLTRILWEGVRYRVLDHLRPR